MKVELRRLNSWLFGSVLLLIVLYYGRPLLVPLVFALLLWGVLNAFVELLQRFRVPAWIAWLTAFALIGALLYSIVVVLATEAMALVDQLPAYLTKLQHAWTAQRALERVIPAPHFAAMLKDMNAMAILSQAAGSIGGALANLVLVAIYVGFLLVEQRDLPDKLARVRKAGAGTEGEEVMHLIGRRIQSYLGVCTFLSIVMGAITYVLLAAMGLEFAGFWALMMFFLTYIPVLGAIGAGLPAIMALAQFGALGPALLILLVLGVAHFVLTDIVETVMLGHSLNLSPFVIMVALAFWGLIWGISGLFLAVPMTSAFAIACGHLEGLEWISALIAAPPRWQRRWSVRWLALRGSGGTDD